MQQFTALSSFAICVLVASTCFSLCSCREHKAAVSAPVQQPVQQATPSTTTAPIAKPIKDEASCKKFVQDFYDWYTTPGFLNMDDVMKQKPQLLDAKLFALIKYDRDCVQSSHEICALDFDPYTNSQDPAEKYIANGAQINGNRCRVPVLEARQGTIERPRVLEAELEWQTDHWVFYDFYYYWDNALDNNARDLRGIIQIFTSTYNDKEIKK